MRVAESINSRENDKVKEYIKLRGDVAKREGQRLFTAEGIKLCTDIAAQHAPLRTFCTQSALDANGKIALFSGEHYIISESVADKMSAVKSPQGVFCVFIMPILCAEDIAHGSYVLLENVQDPANVGTIVRSAAAFGYKGVILSEGCASVYSGKALRASMGAAMRIDIVENCDIHSAAQRMRANGAKLYAACLSDSLPLTKIDTSASRYVGIMIGNEGNGISQEAARLCDARVRIPISDKTESLNAAAAASVLLWHFRGGDELWV